MVLKMGEQGAYAKSKECTGQAIPAFPVAAIDTTAAGDAFNGAFAVGLLLEKDPVASARFATAAAALSVTRAGAQPSMPTRPEVEQLLATHTNAHAKNSLRSHHDDEKA